MSHLSPNHVPVLLKEAIDFLNVRRGGTYIDATVGLGGHSYEIAKRLGAPGHLIGLDKDPAALSFAKEKLARANPESSAGVSQATADWPTITLLQCSFAEVGERFGKNFADGILADIGVSSLQLDDAARGFSFQADGPLDMRMDPQSERTAEQVVNHLDERELADVI
ncbi:MAG: 16S rRNA (cytosine(1402)-N(4))-methyltransferase, partial [Candidatus Sulfotelmatobacter sp.]